MKHKCVMLLPVLLSAAMMAANQAPPASASSQAVQILGLEGVKANAKGTLEVKGRSLAFTSPKGGCDIATDSIQDVVTGKDSQRAIGGTVGTISMFAPDGTGRALSLLRNKIDTLTVEYRDATGGLHGAVFTMPVGKAQAFKDELLAEGARTSIPSKADSSNLQSRAQEVQR